MTAKRAAKKILTNGLLALASFTIVFALGEFLLRLRYAEAPRTPTEEVLAIQRHLKLHPKIGFTWNANVLPEDNVVLTVSDVDFAPLSTGAYGFINSPQAIKERGLGRAVDIIGLGDSFMELAAHEFHRYFDANGFAYYGLAMHRQAPPQYTAILKEYALPLQPDWIVYGLFENDFEETQDFQNWERSGLDWFSFHSGTWCGPSLATSSLFRFKDKHLRGLSGLTHVLHSRIRGERMSVMGPSAPSIQAVQDEIESAFKVTRESRADFLLVLIPSRATVTQGPTAESEAYDELLEADDLSEIPVLDLRELFLEQDDPANLYYEIDAHWNANGIALAAEAILNAIQQGEETEAP